MTALLNEVEAVVSDSEYFAAAREFALKVARRHVADPQTAEDVAQEVMLRLCSLSDRPENVEAWITRAVRNRVIDYRRAISRSPRSAPYDDIPHRLDIDLFLSATGVSPSLMAVGRIRFAEVWADLEAILNEREIEVIRMTVARIPQARIAEELGYANADSVKATLVRIRRKVRELTGDRLSAWVAHPRPY